MQPESNGLSFLMEMTSGADTTTHSFLLRFSCFLLSPLDCLFSGSRVSSPSSTSWSERTPRHSRRCLPGTESSITRTTFADTRTERARSPHHASLLTRDRSHAASTSSVTASFDQVTRVNSSSHIPVPYARFYWPDACDLEGTAAAKAAAADCACQSKGLRRAAATNNRERVRRRI